MSLPRSLRGDSPRGVGGANMTLPVPSAVADMGGSGGREDRASAGGMEGGDTRKLPVPVCVTVPLRLAFARFRAPTDAAPEPAAV